MQVTFALGTTCEIGYKSYVFAAVRKEEYCKVSLYLSGATLLGRSLSSFSSQLLYEYASISLWQLNCISLGSVFLALVLSLFIPLPMQFKVASMSKASLNPSCNDDQHILDRELSLKEKLVEKAIQFYQDAVSSYKSSQTKRWAYWAIVSTSFYFMVGNSAQSLWKDLEGSGSTKKRYNGYVIGVSSLLSSLASWLLTRFVTRSS